MFMAIVVRYAIWSYPIAGNLALSPNGILYIEGTGAGATALLTAVNLQ